MGTRTGQRFPARLLARTFPVCLERPELRELKVASVTSILVGYRDNFVHLL
jgi:hypothetical protein